MGIRIHHFIRFSLFCSRLCSVRRTKSIFTNRCPFNCFVFHGVYLLLRETNNSFNQEANEAIRCIRRRYYSPCNVYCHDSTRCKREQVLLYTRCICHFPENATFNCFWKLILLLINFRRMCLYVKLISLLRMCV